MDDIKGPNQIAQWQAILDTSASDYIADFPVGRDALEQLLLRRVNKHQFAENDPAVARTRATRWPGLHRKVCHRQQDLFQ